MFEDVQQVDGASHGFGLHAVYPAQDKQRLTVIRPLAPEIGAYVIGGHGRRVVGGACRRLALAAGVQPDIATTRRAAQATQATRTRMLAELRTHLRR
jgi:hypothetical protein